MPLLLVCFIAASVDFAGMVSVWYRDWRLARRRFGGGRGRIGADRRSPPSSRQWRGVMMRPGFRSHSPGCRAIQWSSPFLRRPTWRMWG